MAWRFYEWAWQVSLQRASDRLVLLALAELSNSESAKCWPSVETICGMTSMNRKTVLAVLGRLENLGVIEVQKRHGVASLYTLAIPKTAQVPKTVPVPKTAPNKYQKRDDTSAKNGTEPVPKTGHRTSKEPIKEPIKEPVSSSVLTLTPEEPEKPKRKRDPLVSCPETLPDEWREAAKIARPDIDPLVVWRKFRARYGPTNEKKALKTWKRMFLGWIGREYGSTYASQNRFAGGAPRRYADERYRGEDGDEIDYTYGIGKGGRPLRMG